MQSVSGKTEWVAARRAPISTVAIAPNPICMLPARPGSGAGEFRPDRDRAGKRVGERQAVGEADGIHRDEQRQRMVPAEQEGRRHAEDRDEGDQRCRRGAWR